MSTHNIGLDVMDLTDNGLRRPITKVELYRDDYEDDDTLIAGNDEGLMIAAHCPYADKQMVDSVLAMVSGYKYHAFEALSANIDPAAELGDTITVGGIESVIAQITDSGDGYCDICAPGEELVEEEYPVLETVEEQANRNFSTIQSLIAKKNDEILLAIYGENGKGGLNGQLSTLKVSLSGIDARVQDVAGNYSLISQNVDNLALELHGADGAGGLSGQYSALSIALGDLTTTVTGKEGLAGKYTQLEQTVDSLSLSVKGADGSTTSVKLSDGSIDLSGVVTFLSTSYVSGQTKINGGRIDTDTLNLSGKLTFEDFTATDKISLEGAVQDASDAIDGVDEIANGEYRGTFINGTSLYSPEIYAGMFYATGEGRRKGNTGYDAAYYIYDSYTQTKDKEGNITRTLGNLIGYLSYDTNGAGTAVGAEERVMLKSLSYKNPKNEWVNIPIKIESSSHLSLAADGKIFLESATQFGDSIILEDGTSFGTVAQLPAAKDAVNGQLFFVYE